MKLKFTLRRPGGSATDLVAHLDATATIGDLAQHLAASDPQGGRLADRAVTLALADHGRLLDPTLHVGEAGLASGVTLTVAPASDRYSAASVQNAAAKLTVVSGPDAGREFPLAVGSVIIGREADCDLVLSDPLVSRRHVRVNVSDVIEVIDQGSANGLHIDGDPSVRAILGPTDRVRIGDTEFTVTQLATPTQSAGQVEFIRSPVVLKVHEGKTFDVVEAPEKPTPRKLSPIIYVAPLLMGPLLYLVTHRVSALIFIVMSPLMATLSVIEGRISAKKEWKNLQAQFASELAALAEHIDSVQAEEVASRLAEYPSVVDCTEAVRELGPLVWSRRPDQPRFVELRLGLGALATRSSFATARVGRAPYELVQQYEGLVDEHRLVRGVPVVGVLGETAIGVAGPRRRLLEVARALMVQAVTLHAPSELVVTGFLAAENATDWSWMTWLPHTMPASSPLTCDHLASTPVGTGTLLAELESLVEARVAAKADELRPAVMVLVEPGTTADHARLVHLAERGPALGIHVIWLATTARTLPAACRVFLELVPSDGTSHVGFVVEGDTVSPVTADGLDAASAMTVARTLAPVVDAGARSEDASDLPRSVTQFALLGHELKDHPEVIVERWLENNSLLSGPKAPAERPKRAGNLRAVFGQTAAGPHALDLRADGPHALVGGTTGAGKSELLQSWITSLAAAHSPERVTFLLVDYKGGAAFADCTELPHTIGLVTDLSPAMVRRALTSLSAELHFREELFAEHGVKDLQEMEKHGIVGAPPSLVIVVDEFAALVKEVPEFVDGVVNVAQRGRSLGLHLILATQRPAGVIKDNLRANTNLRVALRMADEMDSTDVLGTDAAAHFDPAIPGRAMSKSGPRRLTTFQTAYAGGWTSSEPEPPEIVVEELSLGARRRWEIEKPPAAHKDRAETDIKKLVQNIIAANELTELRPPRKAWLPELRPVYDIATLPTRRRDEELTFAIADDPERQTQPAVSFRPDREGNLAVYGTGGSGKSTLLRSLALAAGFSHRGGPCHVYGIDVGSRGLAMLEDLPHVGSIIPGSDHERIVRLLTWLRQVVDERSGRYAAVNAATITDYRRLAGQPDETRILLLVDGIAAFRSAYETADRLKYIDLLTAIASEGRPVGVHVVMSAEIRTGLTTAMSSAVQRRVVLRMATPDDYAMLGVANDVLDETTPAGRGIDGERQIQVAVLGEKADALSQAEQVRALAAAMRDAGVAAAPPIISLQTEVALADLPVPGHGLVTLGLAGDTLAPADVDPSGAFLLIGPPGSGRSTALAALVASMRRTHPGAELHWFGPRRSALAGQPFWASSSTTVEDTVRNATELTARLHAREAGAPPVMVVVEAAGDFVNTPADAAFQQLVKACVAEEQWFIAEGEVSTVKTGMGFLGLVKSARRGLALQPDQESGAGMFNTAFPRINRNDFPVGRGLLVGSGRSSMVQVARSS
ncbi:FtsK/SpoIIIE domain-containing protein [Nocardioides jejuensis]|uniref:FHA domain-containing protein n=1 Tax=Nocardioides jejuensis TaxID=2502782 RepID=A0A4V6NBF1_9ACTN|nr:FtsK/SpoIIIE domain-containing protein [Nocardioides jejuensis]TCJ30192.1 FHA domain-containing protein [Nocardioides jejuensis]